MNRFLRTLSAVFVTLSAVLGTLSGYSVTATKEYVDRQDASTLQAAKDYTDQHGGGGVDTNTVIDIIHATVDGAARPLPKYLHALDFDDTYPDAAADYYAQRQGGGAVPAPQCSAVRSGGFLYRNFDYPFDDRAEFVVKMSAGAGRFASVGVAQVGTNLTEEIVTSGKPSRWYKALPGATVDGINSAGVVAEINVVSTNGVEGWHGDPAADGIHCLGAVRWVLDNATSAAMAASNLAARVYVPQGLGNFHYMIADETSTYIVENGSAHLIQGATGVPPVAVLTNFRLYPSRDTTGEGQERYDLLLSSACCITNAWYTRAYSPTANWASEFKDEEEQNAATNAWARLGTMEARRATGAFWQTVHTSVYDISNRILRVAVQERGDWYTFALPFAGTDEAKVREIAGEVVAPVASTVESHTSQLSQLSQSLAAETARAMAAESYARSVAVSEAYNAIHRNNDAEFRKVTLSSDVTTPVVDAGVVQAKEVRVVGNGGLFTVGPSVNIVVSGDHEFSEYGLPMIGEWARSPGKPTYTYDEIGGTFPGITAHQSLEPATNYTDTAIAAAAQAATNYTDACCRTLAVSATNYTDTAIADETTRATAAESALSNTVNAWQTYWDGDDVRLTVTNYFGKADLPRLYIEQRTNEVAMATNLYKVIWDEGTRLAPITNDLAGLAADLAALDEAKADRDWGRYDSHTGGAAPAGYTSVSSPGIVLGAGLAWQNVGLNDGEVWVLTATDPQTVTVAESGTFSFHDADGNPMIEIVKGDRRVVGATVSAVSKTDSTFEITFNVVSTEHPTIYAATNLVGAVWHEEGDGQFPGSVTWSGQSGAWVATVGNIAAHPQLFFRGVYEIGGESYVKIAGERCDPGEIDSRLDDLENALGNIDAALAEILGVNNEP